MDAAIDPFAPDALEDPYDLYAHLQREAPVHQLPGTEIWLVTRHADVVEAASRPEIFSSNISAVVYTGGGPNPVVLAADPDAIGAVDVLATADPPDHTAQRKLMNRVFAPKVIASLEPMIRAFVVRAVDEALARGSMEWMEALSIPLPVAVVSAVLGLPPEDGGKLKSWGDAGVDLLSGVAPAERMGECWQLMVEFLAYLRDNLAAPTPGSITADIAEAVARADLTEREGVSLMLQLVIAGSESTASLMGSAVFMLAKDPSLQDDLRAHPEKVAVFLEEALRLESPFRGHFRLTKEDTTLGGVELPKGSRVMLMWGAGNRDPHAYHGPADLDLGREKPKQHLAFGSGIHFCLGAPLARLEAKIAVEELLARAGRVSLADGKRPRHPPSLFVRRLESLPLTLER
jgi:cytochrome P450 family 144